MSQSQTQREKLLSAHFTGNLHNHSETIANVSKNNEENTFFFQDFDMCNNCCVVVILIQQIWTIITTLLPMSLSFAANQGFLNRILLMEQINETLEYCFLPSNSHSQSSCPGTFFSPLGETCLSTRYVSREIHAASCAVQTRKSGLKIVFIWGGPPSLCGCACFPSRWVRYGKVSRGNYAVWRTFRRSVQAPVSYSCLYGDPGQCPPLSPQTCQLTFSEKLKRWVNAMEHEIHALCRNPHALSKVYHGKWKIRKHVTLFGNSDVKSRWKVALKGSLS